MKGFSGLLLATVFSFGAATASAAAWKATNSWNLDWEKKYAEFIENDWSADVFIRPGSPLYGVETDCADAVISARAYFSFLNQLPFQITTRSGLVPESTSQFDGSSAGISRFKAFLNSVVNSSSTRTLSEDTFPIKLSPQYFRAGVIYLSPGNHSYTVKQVRSNGYISTVSSTVPAQIRKLIEIDGFPMFIPSSDKYLDGYRAFRWPEEYGVSIDKISRAGTEQFQLANASNQQQFLFADQMALRIGTERADLKTRVEYNLKSLCSYANERAVWALISEEIWKRGGRKCMSSQQNEDFSTNSRDKQLVLFFQNIRKLAQLPEYEELDSSIKNRMAAIFNGNGDSGCLISSYSDAVPAFTLFDVWTSIQKGQLISDPNSTIAQRWGFAKFESVCRY